MNLGVCKKVEDVNRLYIEIPGDMEEIDEAEKLVIDFLDIRKIRVDLFAIRLILRESLTNAVLYGTGKDPNKVVKLTVEVTDDKKVIIRVKDPGPGFDWKNIPDDFDVLADGGRGIFILRIYSDELRFSDVGNEVTIIKNI